MWWCPSNARDFRWWHLHQHWKGIKEGCMRGWGFQFQVPSLKFRAQVSLLQSTSVHPCTGLARNFYAKANILCLVPCFIMVIYFYVTGHQFLSTFLAWVAAELIHQATQTGVPDTKDWHTLLLPMEASRYGSQSTQSSPCTVTYILWCYMLDYIMNGGNESTYMSACKHTLFQYLWISRFPYFLVFINFWKYWSCRNMEIWKSKNTEIM